MRGLSLGGVFLVFAFGLAACGGGGSSGGGNDDDDVIVLPPGAEISTPGIESYTTDHNGFARVRTTPGNEPGDAAVLAKFDGNTASPAGYRNLVALTEERFQKTMTIEVIAEMGPDGAGGEKAVRILRLTADQAPFENANLQGQPITTGRFFFRGIGQNRVWATIDDGELLSGVGDLENLMVDFGAESATIHLRTTLGAASDIETEIKASNVPFNIRTGAFGGPITLTSRVDANTTLRSRGVLRGNINSTPAGLSQTAKDLTTSGLYTVAGQRLSADGVFYGSQPD